MIAVGPLEPGDYNVSISIFIDFLCVLELGI